ncbi:MAG: DUF4345 family protein [Parvibaculum sp.]|nr:DUF4345 family protein [Parvibaculum sp.]
MQSSFVLKTILFIAGLIGASVGIGMLVVPVPFHATTGIELGDNVSLLNEMRAAGGALLAAGLLILSGVFFNSMALTATVVATVLYLAYGLSRTVSLIVDGPPDSAVYLVMTLELIVGLACAMALMRHHKPSKE